MAGAAHGGAEAFFDRLVGALARAGVAQHVLTRNHPERLASLRGAGLAPIALRFGGVFDWTTGRRFRREIEQFGPDLVLTWMSRATAFCPARGSTARRFVHVGRLGGYYDPKYYRACAHLIANTADIRDWLVAQGFAAEIVHVLPNFVAATPATPVARAAFDTPADAPLLLGLGRLHVNKAFDVLIDALAALPGAFLWLAGEGPERAGRDGLLAPVDDAAALAAALRRLIDDRALGAALARAGRARYETEFTESAVVRRYLAFFNQVCG
ncbi:MAG: glycosyltransferase [Proteobacteria bacterium]|nr:glycosyltransferase [Pseudomonadota bacterium]